MSDQATTEAAAHAATSQASFYILLTIPETYHPTAETPTPPAIPPALLRKSYRQTSLRYHPDKNPSPDAAALFHTLTTAYGVLGDVATKAAYDQALVARLVRKRKSEAMDVQRRRMKDDLEERERVAAAATGGFLGAKRQRMDEESELEKRLETLREEGARLKMKREEVLRKAEMKEKEELEEEKRRRRSRQSETLHSGHPPSIPPNGETRFSDLDKTIFIKFHTEPPKHSDNHLDPIIINEPTLYNFFSKFGEITSCLVRKPLPASVAPNDSEEGKGSKKKKKKKKKDNPSTTTAVLVFKSILAAYDVIHRFRMGGSDDPQLWQQVKDVKFARGEDPDLSSILAQRNGDGGYVLPIQNAKATSAHVYSSPSSTTAFMDSNSNTPKQVPNPSPIHPHTTPFPDSATATSTSTSTTIPRFSFHNPQAEPKAKATDAGPRVSGLSPTDYELRTLMRMREMERELLQVEIKAKEAEIKAKANGAQVQVD